MSSRSSPAAISPRLIPFWVWIVAGLGGCIFGLAQCMDDVKKPAVITNAKGDEYVGSAACEKCHAAIAKSYAHTAHARSSRPAEKQFIKGSFAPGNNTFSFNDYSELAASVEVRMEQRDSGLYQVAYINGMPRRAERFGVVMGAGQKAQSYLYWRGSQLLQLPVSWFAATASWANSPGFPTDQVKFNRLIPAHCMECHSTMANLLPATAQIPGPNPPAFFDRQRMIYGVGCESCHGPGGRHVEYQLAHPEDHTAKYIVDPAKLSGERSLDICAACHSGIRTSLLPPFSFVPGDTLSNYFGPGPAVDTGHAEVHGNQYGLLAASKCFRVSGTMECRTCHAPHRPEENDLAAFSQRCMSCHQPAAMLKLHNNTRDITETAGDPAQSTRNPAQSTRNPAQSTRGITKNAADITRNCIDCHMPVQASSIVTLMVPGKKELAPLFVRNHRIAIYTDTKRLDHSEDKIQRH
jgi:hypothetical protein